MSCTVYTHLCPFSKSKFNLYKPLSLTASTLLHRLVMSIELGAVQTGTGKVDPARKFKCTTAARVYSFNSLFFLQVSVFVGNYQGVWNRREIDTTDAARPII